MANAFSVFTLGVKGNNRFSGLLLMDVEYPTLDFMGCSGSPVRSALTVIDWFRVFWLGVVNVSDVGRSLLEGLLLFTFFRLHV